MYVEFESTKENKSVLFNKFIFLTFLPVSGTPIFPPC